MALMERVSTLLRANLNELIEKAENPEKLLKQLVLDMENQLLQVKTQVAIAIADEHLLERKRAEHAAQVAEWKRRAQMAVDKGHDDMARAALERVLSYERLMAGFEQQAQDQRLEADSLRQMLRRLEQKLSETRAQCEMLAAEHRRARLVGKAHEARQTVGQAQGATLERMKHRVDLKSAQNLAGGEVLAPESLEDRFRTMEQTDQIELLLAEMKSRPEPAALPEPQG